MDGSRRSVVFRAAGRGAVAGLAGVAAMTAGEKLEQLVTGRPNSYIPGRTLLTLLGRHPAENDRPPVWNHLMHWGTGAVLGSLRGIWAVTGIRGPGANVLHTAVRLAFDQTLENASGAGAPPKYWPAGEQVIDVAHKAVYSLATGIAADSWIAPTAVSLRGAQSS
jgi:hypothetical protein